jgi:hypothetical protein
MSEQIVSKNEATYLKTLQELVVVFTHLITILEGCSRAGNAELSHEILTATAAHTRTINALQTNAQPSTTQCFPCPQHTYTAPLLFVYK